MSIIQDMPLVDLPHTWRAWADLVDTRLRLVPVLVVLRALPVRSVARHTAVQTTFEHISQVSNCVACRDCRSNFTIRHLLWPVSI